MKLKQVVALALIIFVIVVATILVAGHLGQ